MNPEMNSAMNTAIVRVRSFLRCLEEQARDLPLLLFRLTLAYGFYGPAMQKASNFASIPGWFASLGIPFPTFNAYMAVGTELGGVILLTLGLATRLIALPMIGVMIVATATVHYANGFACGDNGFEVPFYYILMLVALIVFGAGRVSLDYLIGKKVLVLWSC